MWILFDSYLINSNEILVFSKNHTGNIFEIVLEWKDYEKFLVWNFENEQMRDNAFAQLLKNLNGEK